MLPATKQWFGSFCNPGGTLRENGYTRAGAHISCMRINFHLSISIFAFIKALTERFDIFAVLGILCFSFWKFLPFSR